MDYDYYRLANDFLKQVDSSSETGKGRMSYKGKTLYSYNSVLAKLDTTNNILYINIPVSHCSDTSRRQTYRLQDSTTTERVLSINFDKTNKENLELYIQQFHEGLKTYQRSRKDTIREANKSFIQSLVEDMKLYLEFNKVDKRLKVYKEYKQLTMEMFKHKLLEV